MPIKCKLKHTFRNKFVLQSKETQYEFFFLSFTGVQSSMGNDVITEIDQLGENSASKLCGNRQWEESILPIDCVTWIWQQINAALPSHVVPQTGLYAFHERLSIYWNCYLSGSRHNSIYPRKNLIIYNFFITLNYTDVENFDSKFARLRWTKCVSFYQHVTHMLYLAEIKQLLIICFVWMYFWHASFATKPNFISAVW